MPLKLMDELSDFNPTLVQCPRNTAHGVLRFGASVFSDSKPQNRASACAPTSVRKQLWTNTQFRQLAHSGRSARLWADRCCVSANPSLHFTSSPERPVVDSALRSDPPIAAVAHAPVPPHPAVTIAFCVSVSSIICSSTRTFPGRC